MRVSIFLVLLTGVLLGCGGGDDAADPDGGSDAAVDAPIPDGYQRLIGRTWSLNPGQPDTYRCTRVTVTEDVYITNFAAQSPTGTHHTVLSIASGGTAGPDGDFDCSATTLGMVMLYASGLGTSPLDFPPDVAVRVTAGQQLLLNLHLFNTSDQPLGGDTAILIKKVGDATGYQLAEMVFAGTALISIPSDGQPHSVTGGCAANQSYTLMAVWPHMHQIGTHMKVQHTTSNGVEVLHDRDYAFAEQRYYLQSPTVPVAQGDRIDVTCTYVNNTGHTVSFGDGSNDEMCFGGLYRYPAQGGTIFECSNIPF